MKGVIKYILAAGLVLAAFFDFMTFFWHKQFLVLESNPLYIITNSVLPLVFVKLMVTGICIYYLFNGIDKHIKYNSKLFHFLWLQFIIMCIILQCFGAGMNIYSKNVVAKRVGAEHISDVTAEQVQKYAVKNTTMIWWYGIGALVLLFYPLVLSGLSFKAWERWD